jgi:uncharacterized membrane protein YkoI
MSHLSLHGKLAKVRRDRERQEERELIVSVEPTPTPVIQPIPGEEIAAELAREYGQYVYELLADLLIIERRQYREAFRIAA